MPGRTMAKVHLLLLLALVSSVSGFVVPSNERTTLLSAQQGLQLLPTTTKLISSSSTLLLANNNNGSNEGAPFSMDSITKLIGPLFLGVLSLSALSNLVTRELPMIFTGAPNADYLGAVFDTLFLGWAGQTLLLQTGALADSPSDMDSISLDGLECRINLDVGREPGTWMEKDWGESGARLVLPIKVRFTNDQIDLGIPGEEGLGGRYCRKLQVLDDAISFVGPQGQVEVPVLDGGWATLPILNQKMEAGERKLRFFLDFPEGAQRNDVSIPSGRVFFSSAVLPGGFDGSQVDMGNVALVKSPSGASILSEGGVSIKSNGGILNLWGATGDINLILGRYAVTEMASTTTIA